MSRANVLRRRLIVLPLLAWWLTCVGCASVTANAEERLVFRFSTVGDSRSSANPAQLSQQDQIWLQSTQVLSRMTREIQAQRSQALIFNGDMIYGYTADPHVLDKQYAYWRGMVAHLFETGTYVLPVPGNHEVQVRRGQDKQAEISGERAWRANMGDLILNEPLWTKITKTRPAAWNVDHSPTVGTDGVTTDQRQLSYSFDMNEVHLAVINTDPVGFDGSAPVKWLAADLAAAKARGMKHFFVFGHKMAFPYVPNPQAENDEVGLDARPAIRDEFWALVERYGATYFCGHQHVYHASQPGKASGGKAWQVIVGSGGSPFSFTPATATVANDRMYAWADVAVYSSGRVHVKVFGFDERFGPTTVLQAWDQ